MELVEVKKITYYAPAKAYKVELRTIKGSNEFPVIVGTMEAQSIALALEGINLPRPLTHDLICNILNKFDAEIEKIIISNQENSTFFSTIIINSSKNMKIKIDSRPSDAIALALREKSEIYVSKSLIKNLKSNELLIQDTDENIIRSKSINVETKIIENLEQALDRAIQDEDYEVAPKLRDRIQYIKKDF